jgi:hypothetical protein
VDEIEERAESVLAAVPSWIWDGESLPVPVETIADSHFGLLVRDVDDLRQAPGAPHVPEDQSLSGLLLPGASEIWVSAAEARDWPPRRRFTIGHELGHWVLHSNRAARGAVYCRSTSVDPDPAADDGGPPLAEREANVFGAALLMPARLLREQYARDRDFHRLCRIFGASGAAMGRRLHRVI